VIGGGPAGLYAALLLKGRDPGRTVRVVERNPPGTTYGWGIVFSDQALERLQAADLESHRAIVASFAPWNAIEIVLDGAERVRARGHGFAGLSRQRLLDILLGRCQEVGVEVCHGEIAAGADELARHDLVVAADGVRSGTRSTLAEHLEPSFDERPAKFAWYGTTLRPDAFTYCLRRTPGGLVQGTVYPYDRDRSTFVAECSNETWRDLGLAGMTDGERLRTCEELFADLLAGHRLESDRTRWRSFLTIRNRRWHHGNVVLLGDAAHTAHFSIGSGTKLAMEDAIALAEALDRQPTLEAALDWYERLRRPVVEAYQAAAWESLRFFERLERYADLDPPQFMFNYLTRSGRITYDEVRVRDSRFADHVDRWFAARERALEVELRLAPPPVFNPLRVRAVTIPNRAVTEHVGGDPAAGGRPGPEHAGELAELAASGAGLVLTGIVAVSPEGRITPDDPGLYDEDQFRAWIQVVRTARERGTARLGLRLGHAGARGSTRPRRHGLDRALRDGGWELMAATAMAYARGGRRPRAMDRRDMDAVREAFACAACRAGEAGFDLLELHLGHGYLLGGFLSPLTNRRDDEYGGDVEGRLRFPLEVVAAARATWPRERPLAVAFSATDYAPGGLSEAEAVRVASRLREAGADVVDVVGGQTVSDARPPSYAGQFLAGLSELLRWAAGVRTITRGGLVGSDDMNTILAAGRADLCVMEPWAMAESGRR
jgi:anthraniloyl-CoA monooxygenase